MVSADVLAALGKCLLLPAVGVLGYIAFLGWVLWRRPDLNDWASS